MMETLSPSSSLAATQFASLDELLLILARYICCAQGCQATGGQIVQRGVQRTLYALCLVSRRFHSVFTPLLWKSISLEHRDGRSNMSNNILSSMVGSRKLHYAQELEIRVALHELNEEVVKGAIKSIATLAKHIPNLEYFSWKSPWGTLNPEILTILARNCPMLKVLECRGSVGWTVEPLRLLDSVTFPALRVLVYYNIHGHLLAQFISSSPNLELAVVHFHRPCGVWLDECLDVWPIASNRPNHQLPHLIGIYSSLRHWNSCPLCSYIEQEPPLFIEQTRPFHMYMLRGHKIEYRQDEADDQGETIYEVPAIPREGENSLPQTYGRYVEEVQLRIPKFGSLRVRTNFERR
ncbi:hypothetical protein F5Y04DRAFT_259658 [Hypomontagnella monticulosa]|nr:hypothetical protein F5Y04DRAFT_259658 [Hypomontagnella monticulosa]